MSKNMKWFTISNVPAASWEKQPSESGFGTKRKEGPRGARYVASSQERHVVPPSLSPAGPFYVMDSLVTRPLRTIESLF
jgi:hypothetical protein